MKVTFTIKRAWLFYAILLLICLAGAQLIVGILHVIFVKQGFTAFICFMSLFFFFRHYLGTRLQQLCDNVLGSLPEASTLLLTGGDDGDHDVYDKEESGVSDPADHIAAEIVASLNMAQEECLQSQEEAAHNFIHRLNHEGSAFSVIVVNRKERAITIAAEKNLGRRIATRLRSYGIPQKRIRLSTRTG
jgi:hypothetical protein